MTPCLPSSDERGLFLFYFILSFLHAYHETLQVMLRLVSTVDTALVSNDPISGTKPGRESDCGDSLGLWGKLNVYS